MDALLAAPDRTTAQDAAIMRCCCSSTTREFVLDEAAQLTIADFASLTHHKEIIRRY